MRAELLASGLVLGGAATLLAPASPPHAVAVGLVLVVGAAAIAALRGDRIFRIVVALGLGAAGGRLLAPAIGGALFRQPSTEKLREALREERAKDFARLSLLLRRGRAAVGSETSPKELLRRLGEVPRDSFEALAIFDAEGHDLAWAGDVPLAPPIPQEAKLARRWKVYSVELFAASNLPDGRVVLAMGTRARDAGTRDGIPLPPGARSARLVPAGAPEDEAWQVTTEPERGARDRFRRQSLAIAAALLLAGALVGALFEPRLDGADRLRLAPFLPLLFLGSSPEGRRVELPGYQLAPLDALLLALSLLILAAGLRRRRGEGPATLGVKLRGIVLLAFGLTVPFAAGKAAAAFGRGLPPELLLAASLDGIGLLGLLALSALALPALVAALFVAGGLTRLRTTPSSDTGSLREGAILASALGLVVSLAFPSFASWLAPLLVFIAGWSLSERSGPGSGVFRSLLVLLAAGTTVLPPLFVSVDGARRTQVENDLVPSLTEDPEKLTEKLRLAIGRSGGIPDLDLLTPTGEPWPADLALHLWRRFGFDRIGFATQVEVRDATGTPRSRYGRSLPSFFEDSSHEQGSQQEMLRLTWRSAEAVHWEGDLRRRGIRAGRLLVHAADPLHALPGNLFLREPAGIGAEGLPEGVLVARYRPDDKTREGTPLGWPPLEIIRNGAVPAPDWRSFEREGELRIGRIVALQDGGSAVVSLPNIGAADRIRAAGTLANVAVVVLVALGLFVELARHGVRRISRALATLRGRLALALVLLSVVPFLAFALFLRGYLERRIAEDTLSHARLALSAARNELEDQLTETVRGPRPAEITDDSLVWLGGIVGYDLAVYREGALLATGRRDLLVTGALPERLDAAAFRRIELEGWDALSVEGRGVARAFASVRYVGRQDVLAVPVARERRLAEREASRWTATLGLVSASLLALTFLVAARVAGRLTRPLEDVTDAVRRLGRGEEPGPMPRPRDVELQTLVESFLAMAADVRRRGAELEQERSFVRDLLDHLSTGVLAVGGDLRVVAANPAAARLFGIEDPTGRLVSEVAPQFSLEEISRATLEPSDEEFEQTVMVRRREGGREIRIRGVALDRPGEGRLAIILADDVTAISRGNRLSAWAEMAQLIAHEIKNPLTPIRIAVEHLQEVARRQDPRLPEILQVSAERVLAQVEILRRTAGEFGDFARLPEQHRKPFDLAGLIGGIVDGYRSGGRRILESDLPEGELEYVGDERLLRRAVTNLVENAFQATKEGGTIRVSLQEEDSSLRIVVDDDGPGIPPDERERIFDPYFSTKATGTGLGLALTKRAASAHGGSVKADAGPLGGARIVFSLPRRRGGPGSGGAAGE